MQVVSVVKAPSLSSTATYRSKVKKVPVTPQDISQRHSLPRRKPSKKNKQKNILFLTFNLMIFPMLITTSSYFYLSPGSFSLLIILSCSLYKTPSNRGSGLENQNPLFVVCKWAFASSEFIWHWLLLCKHHLGFYLQTPSSSDLLEAICSTVLVMFYTKKLLLLLQNNFLNYTSTISASLSRSGYLFKKWYVRLILNKQQFLSGFNSTQIFLHQNTL